MLREINDYRWADKIQWKSHIMREKRRKGGRKKKKQTMYPYLMWKQLYKRYYEDKEIRVMARYKERVHFINRIIKNYGSNNNNNTSL